MIFILILGLLIFGPKRLPEVGRTIGKGMAQFRKATTDLRRTIETEIALEDEPRRQTERLVRPPRPASTELQLPAPAPQNSTTPATPVAPAPAQTPDAPVEVLPGGESDPGKSEPGKSPSS
jgi:sec-independent protein translocase protein TatB